VWYTVKWRLSIQAALDLIDHKDKLVLGLLIGIQAVLSLFDLLALALLGLVVALSASELTGQPPALLLRLLDSLGVGEVDPITLSLVLAFVAATFLVTKSVTSFLVTRRTLRFLANRQATVSGKLAGDLLAQPLLFVQRRSSQQTAYALTIGVNSAILGVLGNAVLIASELALVTIIVVGLAILDLVVTAFTVVFFVIVGLLLHKILANWAGNLGSQVSQTEVASYSTIQEVIGTYREVSVAGRRSIYIERFHKLRWNAAVVQADLQIMSQVSKYVFEIALVVGGGLLAVSQLLTRDVAAALSVIVVFLAAASRLMPSLLRMQVAFLNIRSYAGSAELTFSIAKEVAQAKRIGPESRDFSPDTVKLVQLGLDKGHADFDARLQLKNVVLSYPHASAPAISGVSLNVNVGTSLALVGSTGAGKSTLADLMLGVLSPDSGTVTIGGTEPSDAICRSPGAIAYVPQATSLVNGTIRDNVALGLSESLVADDRVWEALDRAQLSAFLSQHRDGLETIVGEGGIRLSGGQRQRLGLARAFYTRPKMIVLDEATSALDAETEQAISQTLLGLKGEVTIIVVAHRLATIRDCDQVAFLDQGRIIALGTFEEVREMAPNFDHHAKLMGL